jgi:hypothetical protein
LFSLLIDVMFPTGTYNQGPIGYQFPGQQPPASLYQSQFGAVGGFNQQVPSFQQALSPRGQSLPASGRQYPPPSGQCAPAPSSSSRRQQQGQCPLPPPPASSQHYEYRSSHGSKSIIFFIIL